MRCGYNKYLEILHIHHIKREKRREPLRRSRVFREWPSKRILPKDVELLCPTCHWEIHFAKNNLPSRCPDAIDFFRLTTIRRKIMFKLVRCEDVVRIPPEKFGMPLEEVAEEQLRLRYEGTLDDNLGYIIAITDVKVDPTGRLVMGEGATFHRVRFTMLTFIPEIQEIIEGEVIEVEDFGAFVRIGPMDGLLHISQVMDDVIAYDEKQGMLIGTRSGRILRGGDKVRMRITAVSLAKGVSGRIGVTTRQPFLGKLEWIEDEVRRIREALVKREKRE